MAEVRQSMRVECVVAPVDGEGSLVAAGERAGTPGLGVPASGSSVPTTSDVLATSLQQTTDSSLQSQMNTATETAAKRPNRKTNTTATNQPLRIEGKSGEKLSIRFVRDNIVRVSFLPDGKRRVNTTWALDPQHQPSTGSSEGTVFGIHGCDREILFDKVCTDILTKNKSNVWSIASKIVQVQINTGKGHPPQLHWNYQGKILARDLVSTSYAYQKSKTGHGAVFHFMERRSPEEEAYFGLGEVPGYLNRYGARIRLDAVDAMGYNCEPGPMMSGPLYKHYPILFVNVRERTAKIEDIPERWSSLGWYCMFYDNQSRGVVDLGAEISAFRGSYRYIQFEDGDLEYYMIFGKGSVLL